MFIFFFFFWITTARQYSVLEKFLFMTMDPCSCAQNVVRSNMCQTAPATMCCNDCLVYVCKDCLEDHFSNEIKVHKVVNLKWFLSTHDYPKCQDHLNKDYNLLCKICDVPICIKCISSAPHSEHKAENIFEKRSIEGRPWRIRKMYLSQVSKNRFILSREESWYNETLWECVHSS